ncbi:unnamed protein product [Didymodactylos carnosus]|uniref:Uncharacterized protein n=1 Tax=Didymodactylos carnosus TaxID=1234261 RepID=A0A814YDE0_9BILA|nr:unnamed protein product [Didymodactylos carnosus]CAF1229013.1 unnamed protein product [Didymodactylos carnosus]CAF3685373.1 unnamed protein product [Didymodactylos carnosus]CAF3991741.1 unnamed protein product [Didymodactylos carnosus]
MREISFKSPINCYDDQRRFRLLVLFHSIDTLTIFIRLIILCAEDFAKITPLSGSDPLRQSLSYLIPIFLFEMFIFLIILISNVLYIMVKCCLPSIYPDSDEKSTVVCCKIRTLWHIATLTCFTCKCYYDHPQGILLTRLSILSICFLFRFIGFILGASCANRYAPRGVVYTVISSLSLVPSIIVLVIEFIHFFRLWTYRPDNNNQHRRFHRSHLCFIPQNITNDKQVRQWNTSLCPEPLDKCKSKSLHHYVLYHSLSLLQQQIPQVITEETKIVIAYYQTTRDQAYKIAYEGFPHNRTNLDSNIYFTLTVQKVINSDTVFFLRLNLDCLKIVGVSETYTDKELREEAQRIFKDTVYRIHAIYFPVKQRIYLKYIRAIEKWLIVIASDNSSTTRPTTVTTTSGRCATVKDDQFHDEYYPGCIQL